MATAICLAIAVCMQLQNTPADVTSILGGLPLMSDLAQMSDSQKRLECRRLYIVAVSLSNVSTPRLRQGIARFVSLARQVQAKARRETAPGAAIWETEELRRYSIQKVAVLDRLVFVVKGSKKVADEWGFHPIWMASGLHDLSFPITWINGGRELSMPADFGRWSVIGVLEVDGPFKLLQEFRVFARHLRRRQFSNARARSRMASSRDHKHIVD